MMNVSSEFKNLVKNGAKIVNYADITLKDGTVLNLGPSDFAVGGFSMSDKTTNGKFEIGTAIAKNISVTIANHTNKFSAYDFYKAIIYMYVAIEKEDGTVLKERKGKYYVINPTSPGDTIKLSGVDSMYLFDKPYNQKKAFPATLQTILSDCCIDCGVNIGFGEFDNWNFTVMNAPEECTYRQVVSWVAQIAGCHARINNNDYLELVWYDTSSLEKLTIDGGNYIVYENKNVIDGGDFTNYDSDIVIDGGNFTDYYPPNVTKIKPPTISTDNVVITGVKVEYNKKEVILGTEDYLISVKDNPFVADKENEVCQYLADRLIGLSFRPLSCQMVNNPLFEPFDSCYVYDRKGNAYFTLINDVTYTISGFTTISCKAEDPVRNESSYVSESAKAIVQAKRETANQLSVYDQAVQNMNLLAANSMGLYRESETQSNGSVIYYMSNRPIAKDEKGICIFEEGSVVYKMTGDGFFVSTDGGVTYTSGFDSEGNAIVNVLSAIGITFDWAKGGTLSLGGDNNINGSMVVYDAENNIVGKFNKDGLWATNGYFEGTIKSSNAYITGGQIAIITDSQTHDTIKLTYGTKVTYIAPDYLMLNENASKYLQLTSSQISMINGGNKVFANDGSITIERSRYTTVIQGDTASFGGSVAILGGLSVKGETSLSGNINLIGNVMSPANFKYAVEIMGTGSLKLNTGANLECYGKATFYNGIYEGTAFSVDTVGNVTANGAIKSTGNYESSLYKLSLKDSLTVSGETKLNGNVKIGDGTYDNVGFFGSSGSSKKTVTTIFNTSSATASSNATKINEIISALKAYNLL